MNTIQESDIIDNLRDIGIDALTGEACAYGMRLLCDVRDKATLELLNDYFSSNLTLAESWNSGVGSIMLSRSTLVDIYIFSLLRDKPCLVVYYDMTSQGCYNQYRVYTSHVECNETHAQSSFLDACARHSWSSISYGQPHVGSRNVHAFSGRAT